MIDEAKAKEEAKRYIRYEKDVANRIAYLTFNRPERLNAVNIAMHHRFADLVFQANIDDEVKVLVIRGEGKHFGGGGDVTQDAVFLTDDDLLYELRVSDANVKYPPPGSFRYLFTALDNCAKARSGRRALQEFKKISIVEAKGYCYGWHFFPAADADIVISSDDALFGHPAFRYAGWAPRQWTWIEIMGYRKFAEMLFTGRPFTADEMYRCKFVNSVVPRSQLEAETAKYALACARSRPTDTVVVQKTFLELYKQYHGEYFGSLLTAFEEGLLPAMTSDTDADVRLDAGALNQGVNNMVKDIEMSYPPEWRMSLSGRRKP